MKYFVYAKILGDFLPSTKPIKINDCKIEKDISYFLRDFSRDIPQTPVYEPTSVYHVIKQGVEGFIQFPQEPISARYFESSHFISTCVEETNTYHAVRIAKERFTQTVAVLSLTLKTTIKKIPRKKIHRDGYYDFEVMGLFIKSKGKLIRVKMPEPPISHRNFFPAPLPKSFLHKAKKMLSVNDSVFQKGLGYIIKASNMRNSGIFSPLDTVLNFVKCIELISNSVGIPKVVDSKTGKLRDPHTKELFELSGKMLKVRKKNWEFAKQAWDVRNVSDVAHQSVWDWRVFPLSYESLGEAANDYLLKYYKWITTRP